MKKYYLSLVYMLSVAQVEFLATKSRIGQATGHFQSCSTSTSAGFLNYSENMCYIFCDTPCHFLVPKPVAFVKNIEAGCLPL
jgi:hypothetical protein